MAVVHRFFDAEPDDVFAVLSDGWLFPSWVVGASRIRSVDEAWPAPESEIHHSFGVWPLVLDDTTSIVSWDPPRMAELIARGWPFGEAHIRIDVQSRAGGCFVTMEEHAERGPGALVPAPAMDLLLTVRNREALQRLAWLAEGHHRDAARV